MRISSLLHTKAPILDQLDHRVEFMVRGILQPRLSITIDNKQEQKYFYDFHILYLTKKKQQKYAYLYLEWVTADV